VVKEAAAENDSIEPADSAGWNVPAGILAMVLGCMFIYSMLFATGNWIYSNYMMAGILTCVSVLSGYALFRFIWKKIK
jgi:xanthine/uracil/vitamin C permease (AzgA family)